MAREHAESVRIVRLEVSKVLGADWRETTQRWHETSRQCLMVANTIWQTWLCWHIHKQSANKLRTWLQDRRDKGIKEAGKCPVSATSPELLKHIYNTLKVQFPDLNGRTWGLLQQRIASGIGSRKASSGSLPGWSAILLCLENMPSFTRGLPIPFDARSSSLSITPDGPVVELRLSRGPDGKNYSDKCLLWAKGSRVRGQIEVFKKVVSGEFKFCGSSLLWDQARKKWFVMLSYQRPVHRVPNLDHGLTATLIPTRRVPFELRVPGSRRSVWLQKSGAHISSMRRVVFEIRRSYSANYRLATDRKGHGRTHANGWRDAWSRKWSQFVKRVNHATSTAAVKECVARGIGRLVYYQPIGDVASHRWISTAGASGCDQSTWEFFQLGAMLAYKCQDVGIELVVRKVGGGESPSQTKAVSKQKGELRKNPQKSPKKVQAAT